MWLALTFTPSETIQMCIIRICTQTREVILCLTRICHLLIKMWKKNHETNRIQIRNGPNTSLEWMKTEQRLSGEYDTFSGLIIRTIFQSMNPMHRKTFACHIPSYFTFTHRIRIIMSFGNHVEWRMCS